MTISVSDFETALRRRGVGSPQGDALRAQADALEAAGDLSTPYELRLQAQILDGQAPVGTTVTPTSGGSTAGEIADLVSKFAPIVTSGLTTGLTLAGVLKPAPAPAPKPAAPLSTGAKIALGVSGAALVGGIAYAIFGTSTHKNRGTSTHKSRRARRRG